LQLDEPVNFIMVLSGPAPRSTILLWEAKSIIEEMVKVPTPSKTYCLGPQDAMALLIAAAVPL